MRHIKLYEEFFSELNEASLSGIEFANDDDIHPTKFKPLVQSLKMNRVKMEVEKEEGMHGYPEVKLTGKRKDIEKVLADIWGPDSIDDHEDAFESVVTEAKELFQLDIDSDEHGALGLSVTMKELKDTYKKNKKDINDVEDLLLKFVYDQPEDFAANDTEGMEISGADSGDVYAMLAKEFGIKESVVNEAKSFSESELKSTAQSVADALAKVHNTKANLINFKMNPVKGRVAGFYVHKATNKQGAPSRYWITDSGEVVNAFRNDTFGDGVVGKVGSSVADFIKTFKANESVVNEAEIKSDDEFKEYATTVLQKAFGEDYDETKAGEVIDGILSKSDGDYGAAVGMLTSSLGESVVTEANADGTISDDEEDDMDNLKSDVEFMTKELIDHITKETERIGGPFRAPGYAHTAKKIIKSTMQKKKFKL